MKISRVTGFPFHPSADKQKGTIHVLVRILHARTIIVTPLMMQMQKGQPTGPPFYILADRRESLCQFCREDVAQGLGMTA